MGEDFQVFFTRFRVWIWWGCTLSFEKLQTYERWIDGLSLLLGLLQFVGKTSVRTERILKYYSNTQYRTKIPCQSRTNTKGPI